VPPLPDGLSTLTDDEIEISLKDIAAKYKIGHISDSDGTYHHPCDYHTRLRPEVWVGVGIWDPESDESGRVTLTFERAAFQACEKRARDRQVDDYEYRTTVDVQVHAGACSALFGDRGFTTAPSDASGILDEELNTVYAACDANNSCIWSKTTTKLTQALADMGEALWEKNTQRFVIPCKGAGRRIPAFALKPCEVALEEFSKDRPITWMEDGCQVNPSEKDTSSFFHAFKGEKITNKSVTRTSKDAYEYHFEVPDAMSESDLASLMGAFGFGFQGSLNLPRGRDIPRAIEHSFGTCANSSKDLNEAFAEIALEDVISGVCVFDGNARVAERVGAASTTGRPQTVVSVHLERPGSKVTEEDLA
jgi:hypothetical protein